MQAEKQNAGRSLPRTTDCQHVMVFLSCLWARSAFPLMLRRAHNTQRREGRWEQQEPHCQADRGHREVWGHCRSHVSAVARELSACAHTHGFRPRAVPAKIMSCEVSLNCLRCGAGGLRSFSSPCSLSILASLRASMWWFSPLPSASLCLRRSACRSDCPRCCPTPSRVSLLPSLHWGVQALMKRLGFELVSLFMQPPLPFVEQRPAPPRACISACHYCVCVGGCVCRWVGTRAYHSASFITGSRACTNEYAHTLTHHTHIHTIRTHTSSMRARAHTRARTHTHTHTHTHRVGFP